MRRAATRLSGLGGAHVSLDFGAREDWHYVPRDRPGLAVGAMTAGQRSATWELLGAGLSPTGRTKVEQVLVLEEILGHLEGSADFRDPANYHVALFGRPDPGGPFGGPAGGVIASSTRGTGRGPWGWRIEGHHLSLHFTLVGDRVASTPAFFGANPARVRNGRQRGLRVLGREEDLGRALFVSLSPAQRERAQIAADAPPDLVTAASRRVSLARFEGIPAAELPDGQRAALLELVALYTGDLAPELADQHMARIRAAGVERLHFAWAGSTELGESHYYRVHGPTHLVEYDNRGGDHIHRVLRDLEHDFGGDLLAEHLEREAPSGAPQPE